MNADVKIKEYAAYLYENANSHPDYRSRERAVDSLRNLSYSDDFLTRQLAKEAMFKLGLTVDFSDRRDEVSPVRSDIKADKYIVVTYENSLFRG